MLILSSLDLIIYKINVNISLNTCELIHAVNREIKDRC